MAPASGCHGQARCCPCCDAQRRDKVAIARDSASWCCRPRLRSKGGGCWRPRWHAVGAGSSARERWSDRAAAIRSARPLVLLTDGKATVPVELAPAAGRRCRRFAGGGSSPRPAPLRWSSIASDRWPEWLALSVALGGQCLRLGVVRGERRRGGRAVRDERRRPLDCCLLRQSAFRVLNLLRYISCPPDPRGGLRRVPLRSR